MVGVLNILATRAEIILKLPPPHEHRSAVQQNPFRNDCILFQFIVFNQKKGLIS